MSPTSPAAAPTLDLIKDPDTNAEAMSIGEAAQNALKHVESEAKLNGSFEVMMRSNSQLSERERQDMAVNLEILRHMKAINADLMGVLEMDEAEVKTSFIAEFKEFEDAEFAEHLKKAEAYRAISANLHTKASADTKVTPNQWIERSKSHLKEADLPAPDAGYIMNHFESEISELLQKPYDQTAHDALKNKVMDAINADTGFTTPKNSVFLARFGGFFWALKRLSGKQKINTNILSEQAIDGLFGKTLDAATATDVYTNGNLEVIKALPTGSIRLEFADTLETFYHTGGADDIPASVKTLMTDPELPHRILFVHYKTDEDVLKLFKDMSAGERMVIQRKDGKGSVTIEGCTGDACTIAVDATPPDITEAEIMARPMYYLDHEFDMPERTAA